MFPCIWISSHRIGRVPIDEAAAVSQSSGGILIYPSYKSPRVLFATNQTSDLVRLSPNQNSRQHNSNQTTVHPPHHISRIQSRRGTPLRARERTS